MIVSSTFQSIPVQNLTAVMAREVMPIVLNATEETYVEFLNLMYHYTIGSGDRLAFAKNGTSDLMIRNVFEELEKEELDHYKLAISDLKHFGKNPWVKASKILDEFNEWWYNEAETSQWLGAMYSLENIASELVGIVPSALQALGVAENRSTFILEHLVADDGHGKMIVEASKDVLNSVEFQLGARIGATFWTDLHKDLLER